MPCCNGVHMPLRRRQLAKAAGALLMCLGSASAAGAQASDPSGGAHLGVPATGAPQARLACSSSGGERQHCAADTSSGVVLARSIGSAPCLLGRFTDAFIAMAYRSLTPAEQARIDPMITGFNPADMYAADHVRRVLTTFPGVFSGIGEFTIHKEFVSSKIAGETASLTNPALDRLLDFAAEAGLVALIHNDVDMPFPKPDQEPYPLVQLGDLFRRHPKTTIVWAHIGLGRVIHPVRNQLAIVEKALSTPALSHLYFDISWDEVAKYLVASPESIKATADLINRHPDRFLFGTDEVAPSNQAGYLKVYTQYAPLFAQLTPEASAKVRKGNYERLFDQARQRVRAWERAHVKERS